MEEEDISIKIEQIDNNEERMKNIISEMYNTDQKLKSLSSEFSKLESMAWEHNCESFNVNDTDLPKDIKDWWNMRFCNFLPDIGNMAESPDEKMFSSGIFNLGGGNQQMMDNLVGAFTQMMMPDGFVNLNNNFLSNLKNKTNEFSTQNDIESIKSKDSETCLAIEEVD